MRAIPASTPQPGAPPGCWASRSIRMAPGLACLGYESNFFEGCLIVDRYEQHQTDLPFRLEEDALLFDIELPIAWDFNR